MLNTECYAVEMASFKSARDLLLVGVQEGLLDEEEFLLLHDLNTSSNAEYPYKDYTKFNLQAKLNDTAGTAEPGGWGGFSPPTFLWNIFNRLRFFRTVYSLKIYLNISQSKYTSIAKFVVDGCKDH